MKASDREGGGPLEMSVRKLDVNGFTGKQDWGSSIFFAPCVYRAFADPVVNQGNESEALPQTRNVLHAFIICYTL